MTVQLALRSPIACLRRRMALAAVAPVLVALAAAPAFAADAKPPADPAKPATTVRVGGSPADAEFRDAVQKAHARYREAIADCRARLVGVERGSCVRSAKAELKTAQGDAQAAKDAARRR